MTPAIYARALFLREARRKIIETQLSIGGGTVLGHKQLEETIKQWNKLSKSEKEKWVEVGRAVLEERWKEKWGWEWKEKKLELPPPQVIESNVDLEAMLNENIKLLQLVSSKILPPKELTDNQQGFLKKVRRELLAFTLLLFDKQKKYLLNVNPILHKFS